MRMILKPTRLLGTQPYSINFEALYFAVLDYSRIAFPPITNSLKMTKNAGSIDQKTRRKRTLLSTVLTAPIQDSRV